MLKLTTDSVVSFNIPTVQFLSTDKHEATRGLSATAERLV